MATPSLPLKISALARDSGVSKELIHHYLREGLLPRPRQAGDYDVRHLRLLKLVKRLREERFLPLPVIRQLVEFHGHDPERIELVLLSGATSTPAAATRPLPATEEHLGPEDLERRSGAPRDVVERCRAAGLVRSTVEDGDAVYTPEDANVVSLVHRGTAMGIPFDSFRTIRSYVEIAFDLERASFLPRVEQRPDLGELAREFAARKEIASGFVMNVLSTLIQAHLRRSMDEGVREAGALARSFYRPSEAFLRRHGIDTEIEELRASLGRSRDERSFVRLVQLFALSCRHRELVFAIDRAPATLRRRPDVARARAWALLQLGEAGRALEVLGEAAAARPADPVVEAYLGAARFASLPAEQGVERVLGAMGEVVRHAEAALAGAATATAEDASEARLVAGWLLVALPPLCERAAQGIEALERVRQAADPDARPAIEPASLRIRYRVASAALLCRALRCPQKASPEAAARCEELAREVLWLDPASEPALDLYLGRKGAA
jgi:DNA-binding transcriptional MerR regulator